MASSRQTWASTLISPGSALGVLGLVAFVALIDRLGVSSTHYQQVVANKDLIADILPPPIFIVESFATACELASPVRQADREQLESKLHRLEREYRSRMGYWTPRSVKGSPQFTCLLRSFQEADLFFRITNEQLIPLVHDGRYSEAEQLVQNELRFAYQKNHSAIDDLVRITLSKIEESERAVSGDPVWAYALNIVWIAVFLMGLLTVWGISGSLSAERNSRLKLQEENAGRVASDWKLQQYQTALDAAAIIAITDPVGKICFANDKFCKISGYSPEELIGANHRIVNSGYHPREFWVDMWRSISRGEIWKAEVCNRSKQGICTGSTRP